VDVLALAAEGAVHREAEEVDPQCAERGLVGAADRDLLHAEDAKGTGSCVGHRARRYRARSAIERARGPDPTCSRAAVPSAVFDLVARRAGLWHKPGPFGSPL